MRGGEGGKRGEKRLMAIGERGGREAIRDEEIDMHLRGRSELVFNADFKKIYVEFICELNLCTN